MFTKSFYRPSLLAAMLALSLSYSPAAHADGFMDKVRGAFSATGDAIKDSAKATGNVIKGSAKMTGDVIVGSARATGEVLKSGAVVTGDVLKGTAKAGEAACVATEDVIRGGARATGTAVAATGKAVGTTTGAVAGATGEVIGGSAKAVSGTTGAVVGATENAVGLHHKPATVTAAAAAAKTGPVTSASAATPAVLIAPASPVAPALPVSTTATTAATGQVVPYSPEQDLATAPATQKLERIKAPLPVKVSEKVKTPTKKLAKSLPASSAFAAGDLSPANGSIIPERIVPPQQSADLPLSTEGTRISMPTQELSDSPSWNDQQPVAKSAAFAAQYALRTTPLQANSH